MECLACHTPNVDGARFCAKCGAPLPVNQSPESDPLIGQLIGGRYRITGILGEGGMGRVFHGEQQMGTSVRRVAVKTLLSQFAKDPQTVARFMREVGTVSELEHPNTIKVYDFGQIDGSGDLYIAMELLTGETLEQAMNGQPMNPERVDRILGQVCGSLQEAHDKGIVHRDLKPANIFLTTRAGETDVVKVLDFGIAKRGESKDSKQGKTEQQKLTQQGTILGTPPYMSPEQFTGKELDARSDLYSLAVLAYEMLTGRLPFEAETPWEWMNQHLSVQPFPFETIPQAANVPQKMRQGVMRALSKNRDDRPSTAREFYEDISLGGVRLSLLGGVSSPSSPNLDVMPAGSGRGGQTQIGEPLFPAGAPMGAPPGRTMIGGDPMMPPAQHAVPTAGGQAYPAPPPQRSGGGPNMAVIGLAAFVVLGGGGGAGWYFLKGPGSHSGKGGGDEIIDIDKKDKEKKDRKDDDEKASSSSSGGGTTPESSTSSGGGPTEKPSATSTAKPPPTTQPTAPSSATTKPPQPAAKIDPSCCNGAKGTKQKVCKSIIAGFNGGSGDRGSAIAGANAQGGSCH